MEDNNLSSVYDAYKSISERLGLKMPSPSGKSKNNLEKTKQREILLLLEDYFCWNIQNNNSAKCRQAKDYLHERGYSDENIKLLKFGLVPKWDKVISYVKSKGYSQQELNDACLVCNENGYTSVGTKHIISIPYRSEGEIRGFLFRTIISDVQPKYKANTGLDRKCAFFNMPSGYEEKTIIVVEGEMDALTASVAGVPNVVAIGGSDVSGERKAQIYDALNHNVRRIIFCPDMDADKDGNMNIAKHVEVVKKTFQSISEVSAKFYNYHIATLPEVCDPDEYIRKHGAQAFIDVINNALPWWEYFNFHFSKKTEEIIKLNKH